MLLRGIVNVVYLVRVFGTAGLRSFGGVVE